LDRLEIDPGQWAGRVVTGYGRGALEEAERVTEITCHARGVQHLVPEVATVIEIGGQDSKVIRLGAGGEIHDFAMNDRCAAGTGRFLEMVAAVFRCNLSDLNDLAEDSEAPTDISSTCVVFAESEIISLISSGARREDVAAGAFASIARRVVSLVSRVGGVAAPVVFTGGVAQSVRFAQVLSEALDTEVSQCQMPVFTGAIGAALMAGERA
jgi:predicted CoA-substrate-specific enzyme activase